MDDLAILVILIIVTTFILYMIGHGYWWLFLFIGGIIFILGLYVTGMYESGADTVQQSIGDLKKMKTQFDMLVKS